LEIADKDGNGTLDLKEFSVFFTKIEGIPLSQMEISNLFREYDQTGDNQLSVEEFARAIYNVLLADQEDYSDDDVSEEHIH
jgi:Ca2+-binding EF-hand superfamily protein